MPSQHDPAMERLAGKLLRVDIETWHRKRGRPLRLVVGSVGRLQSLSKGVAQYVAYRHNPATPLSEAYDPGSRGGDVARAFSSWRVIQFSVSRARLASHRFRPAGSSL